jgi:hypothetical protein
MMRKQVAETTADIALRPVSTIENGLIPKLQSAGVLPGVRGRDAGEVDSSYRVNVLLAALLGGQYGVPPAETVRHWRALPYACGNTDFAEQVGIKLKNAGAALDAILETLRTWQDRGSPIFRAKHEAKHEDIKVTVEFCDDTHMVIAFHNLKRPIATLTFGLPPNAASAATGRAERIVRVPHAAFERLAV